ncbi:hypothetical protein KR51_00018330 [Rubidibacter lacunae KORDI 51-2]|uniref:Uncharacterized protein n=1 Tax=Rubidibacter lacunae KORDI 51-2 TaxID=582515 RepID=U5DIW7_9CHRO|nr:hypothetical protein KR51_00018330 [Rubidibacter lacunae KORDI 51-2]
MAAMLIMSYFQLIFSKACQADLPFRVGKRVLRNMMAAVFMITDIILSLTPNCDC